MKALRVWRIAFCSVLLVVAVLCETARPFHAEGTSKAEAGEARDKDWASFPPYPHARFLCNQSVLGRSGDKRVEITWTSYTTRDATEKVIAFYSNAENGKVESEGESITIRRNKDILSVYPASAAGYPTCDRKPQPEEKTVIIISVSSGP